MASIFVVFYTQLLFYVFYEYYWKRIRLVKLENYFHTIMFYLLVACCINIVVCGLLDFVTMWDWIYICLGRPPKWRATTDNLWAVHIIFYFGYLFLDYTSHCNFIMRYWVVSQKVRNIIFKQEDKWLERKAACLYSFLMFWITFMIGM